MGLWSTVTLLAVPSSERTALVSPKLATTHCLLFASFRTKARQQVVPVSDAPTNLSWSSVLLSTLVMTPLRLFLSFSYSCSNIWVFWGVRWGWRWRSIRWPDCLRVRRRQQTALSRLRGSYQWWFFLGNGLGTIFHVLSGGEVFVFLVADFFDGNSVFVVKGLLSGLHGVRYLRL